MRGRGVRRAGVPALSRIVLLSHASGERAVGKLRSEDVGARTLFTDLLPGDIVEVAIWR